MKCEVYVCGYRDASRPQDGFKELVDYGNNPPPSWVTRSLREIWEKLGDRASQKSQGALFVTLEPPQGVEEKDPYFAIVNLRPLSGEANGSRVGYEILAVFAEKSDFNLDGAAWLRTLAKLWFGIDWEKISRERNANYETRDVQVFQENSFKGNLVYGNESNEWLVKAVLKKKQKLPIADFLLEKELQRRLPAVQNVVIGLDNPLQVLPGSNWLWFNVDSDEPKSNSKSKGHDSNSLLFDNLSKILGESELRSGANRSLVEAYLAFDDLKRRAEDGNDPNVLRGKEFQKVERAFLSAVRLKECLDGATVLESVFRQEHRTSLYNIESGLFVPQHQNAQPWHKTEGGKNWIWLGGGVVAAALILIGLYFFEPTWLGLSPKTSQSQKAAKDPADDAGDSKQDAAADKKAKKDPN